MRAFILFFILFTVSCFAQQDTTKPKYRWVTRPEYKTVEVATSYMIDTEALRHAESAHPGWIATMARYSYHTGYKPWNRTYYWRVDMKKIVKVRIKDKK